MQPSHNKQKLLGKNMFLIEYGFFGYAGPVLPAGAYTHALSSQASQGIAPKTKMGQALLRLTHLVFELCLSLYLCLVNLLSQVGNKRYSNSGCGGRI